MKKSAWYMILILIITLLVAPLLLLLVWSFSLQWTYPKLLPEVFGLRGFAYLFSKSTRTGPILFNSVTLSLGVMFLSLLISLPAAKAFGCYDFKGKKLVYTMVLMPLIVPPLTVAMGIHATMIQLGFANRVLGVIFVQLLSTVPYGVRILTGAYALVGERLEAQAKVLGATQVQIIRYVTLPLLMPALVAAGALMFIISFGQYFTTFLIGGGKVVTFAMVMFPFIQSGDRMLASVYSLTFVLVTLGILMVVERLVKGFYATYDRLYL